MIFRRQFEIRRAGKGSRDNAPRAHRAAHDEVLLLQRVAHALGARELVLQAQVLRALAPQLLATCERYSLASAIQDLASGY